jgi:hypothetical protein
MQATTASLALRRGPLAANLRASEAGMIVRRDGRSVGGRWERPLRGVLTERYGLKNSCEIILATL